MNESCVGANLAHTEVSLVQFDRFKIINKYIIVSIFYIQISIILSIIYLYFNLIKYLLFYIFIFIFYIYFLVLIVLFYFFFRLNNFISIYYQYTISNYLIILCYCYLFILFNLFWFFLLLIYYLKRTASIIMIFTFFNFFIFN